MDIPIEDLVRLYKLASLGKLFGGLIHNLNGPMQNLGLDLEMASFSLRDPLKTDNAVAIQNIISRLKRMEEEHGRINSLIRSTVSRTGDTCESENTLLNIYEFVRQELEYLHANLYFKHNVKTEIIINNDPPLVSSLPDDTLMGLSWLVQGLAEELERQKIRGLTINITAGSPNLTIIFLIHDGRLSENFFKQFNAFISSDNLEYDNMDLGIFLAIALFKLNGITITLESGDTSSTLVINFP
jgi:hypothetical protein